MNEKLCPCGSELTYDECCEVFHSGEQLPQTVEALMRSRYSAFVLADDDYLLDTWHPSTSPEYLDLSDNPDWVQLQVISSDQDNDQGRVHFRAFYRDGNNYNVLRSVLNFARSMGVGFIYGATFSNSVLATWSRPACLT